MQSFKCYDKRLQNRINEIVDLYSTHDIVILGGGVHNTGKSYINQILREKLKENGKL